jgi:hypothetical protein
MSGEINISYEDVLKAYQLKSGELLTQLITAEAKINSYSNAIIELTDKMKTLELENNKLKKPITKTKKSSTDNVTDYN